jgi:dienelactone hydrolase
MIIRVLLLLMMMNLGVRDAWAADAASDTTPRDLQAILAREIVSPALVLSEVQDYLEPRVPAMPALTSAKDWTRCANRLREEILGRVVLRGEAARWHAMPLKVEWLETLPGGPGYHIRKLRYETAPGFWIPALLYEPDGATAKLPVVLNVSGHDPNGKAAVYKQVHCINQAKRGMLALNVEWIGMGQLLQPNNTHSRMNQLDLCGTSGVAPFYLALKRGLDVLLAHPQADPQRVAVTGYSGGGWQTIFISALDTRVTFANPVAGYSSFRTRVRHLKDLGDPEQTPCDLATLADYTHLTAMMAPRALLLTYNAKDECCFEAGYVLPPLLEAAQPVFKLFGQESRLRSHINYDPGTHNYEQDNRQAFYRMAGDQFYASDASFEEREIPSAAEVKSKEQLDVPLPQPNGDFNSLALALSKDLPRVTKTPTGGAALRKWQQKQRTRLRDVVKAKDYTVKQATVAAHEEKAGLQATNWRLRIGDAWTLPATELVREHPQGVTILIADAGRRSATNQVARLLAAGQRVVATDPFYFGESKPAERDYLWALLVSAVGDRPLGLQASQVAAVARWLHAEHPGEPVTVCAIGPRTSTVALVAAGLEEQAIARLDLHDSFPSLKAVIQQNHTFEEMPELFCFGLLEAFDMGQLQALTAPRTSLSPPGRLN